VAPTDDPYKVLGISPGVSDKELQAAYRRLVQLHHPDHNHGSTESARRFEEIQEAYARVRKLHPRRGPDKPAEPRVVPDPEVEVRLANLERELREAYEARERARRAAAEAAASAKQRPSDEELGYVRTDDSFGKILADARSELAARFGEVGEHPARDRVADLLDELAAKLKGGGPRKPT
jgi:curved DNA-binding protein CbpA